MGQKDSLAEQESSSRAWVEKEKCMNPGSKVRRHGRSTEMLFTFVG